MAKSSPSAQLPPARRASHGGALSGIPAALATVRRAAVALLAIALLTTPSLLAGPAGGDEDSPVSALPDPMNTELKNHERLEALIERVKHEQARMDTLQARFTQIRESELLVEPEVAQGVFYYQAPEQVRWEYESPNPISVVIDGREMLTWYRDLQRADRLKIGRYSSQVFKYLGASGSMETLMDYFRVSVRFPGPDQEEYRLHLIPKYERISERIQSMTLWIDPERYLPDRLIYRSADGDSTEYRFHDFQINDEIPVERFSLDLPRDVTTREVDLGQNAG